MAKILDGKAASVYWRGKIASDVRRFKEVLGRAPELFVILASDDSASHIYVRNKLRACSDVGIRHSLHTYNPDCAWHGCRSAEAFVSKMLSEPPVAPRSRWDPGHEADGVLVQLPIAGLADPRHLFDLIPPDKDVDVFNSGNVGKLMQGRPRFKTCTPHGIMKLLEFHGIDVCGEDVCIINDSNIVGRPLAMMMTDAGATVTICHKRTPKQYLTDICGLSRIVVVGVGIPNFVTPDMIAPGAIVVDVGINRLEDGRVVGDVSPEVSAVAEWLSPVPGGVGPCTIAALLQNTLEAAVGRVRPADALVI